MLNSEKYESQIKDLSIYIHIPFCVSKCNYCDFNSYAGLANKIEKYFKALTNELISYSDVCSSKTIKTIFIGGGTPSIVEPIYYEYLLNTIENHFKLDKNIEISIESNPGTLTFEKLSGYRKVGINRLSIGLQACQPELLELLGRIHTAEEFCIAIKMAREAGFKNINADLIFGIQGQTMQNWVESIEYVISNGVQHISCYSLKIEEGTKFGDMYERGELEYFDDVLDREMYHGAIELLKKKGFLHYEISNFSVENYECKHNLVYWKCGEYLGIGAGAHSYFNNIRYGNVYSPLDYIELIQSSKFNDLRLEKVLINKNEQMKEFMLLGLRLTKGVNIEEFKARFGCNLEDIFKDEIATLLDKKLIVCTDNWIKLSKIGLDYANQVFMEFV